MPNLNLLQSSQLSFQWFCFAYDTAKCTSSLLKIWLLLMYQQK
ncbi:hypothetical protein Hanom_Chr03g00212541 [Helianthus anomalus]